MERHRAIALLKQRLEELEALHPVTGGAHTEWLERTIATIGIALPEGHRAHNGLTTTRWSPMVYPTSPGASERSFESGRSRASAILKAAIFELEELGGAAQSASTSQPVLAVHEIKLLERMLAEVRTADDRGELEKVDREARAEFDAEVQTLVSQIRSPKPKRSIVRAALQSLRSITEEAFGSAAGVGVVVAIKMAADAIG